MARTDGDYMIFKIGNFYFEGCILGNYIPIPYGENRYTQQIAYLVLYPIRVDSNVGLKLQSKREEPLLKPKAKDPSLNEPHLTLEPLSRSICHTSPGTSRLFRYVWPYSSSGSSHLPSTLFAMAEG